MVTRDLVRLAKEVRAFHDDKVESDKKFFEQLRKRIAQEIKDYIDKNKHDLFPVDKPDLQKIGHHIQMMEKIAEDVSQKLRGEVASGEPTPERKEAIKFYEHLGDLYPSDFEGPKEVFSAQIEHALSVLKDNLQNLFAEHIGDESITNLLKYLEVLRKIGTPKIRNRIIKLENEIYRMR